MFAQYLKASKHPKYSIAQINDYPTTTYAVQIVTTLAYAWASDSVLNGDRLAPIVFGGVSVGPRLIGWKSLLRTDLDFLDHQHHLLRISRGLGHPGGLAMDVLYPVRCRLRTIRSLHGVRDTFPLQTAPMMTMIHIAPSAGPTKSAPTTTKNVRLSWPL